MAASTTTRTTWTNDTGTPTTPVGDGTILNNARLQDIYAAVDQLLSGAGAYATLTLGGLLAVEGLGAHNFSAGGAGGNRVSVRNTSAGTGNYGGFTAGNDASATSGQFLSFSSTYTTAAQNIASGVLLESTTSVGLALSASHASSALTFWSGGASATERMRIDSSGRVGIATSAPAAGALTLATGAIGTGAAIGAFTANHLVLAGGGASSLAGMVAWGNNTGYSVDFGTRDGSGNFLTRQRFLDTGPALFSTGSASAPTVAHLNDTNTGIYFGTDEVNVSLNGAYSAGFTRNGTGTGNPTVFQLPAQAYGTGAVTGAHVFIGRNSSGAGTAGTLGLQMLDGAPRYYWTDAAGNLRIHTVQPTENGSVSDTAGTVVGTQTSTRVTKRLVRRARDTRDALATLLRTPFYRFRYRVSDRETDFVGIMAEESPEFVMHQGQSFNPVNAFGYTGLAIQELARRLALVEARR